ncbi:MAG: NADPH-dependent assimilatory sulfite reductase hemoprotein subunit [Candidatus Sumerlaeia bacterium]|nr:NADPH-dependent assimilatory sulfite reductase hemoprotein subunit [Candidatus Sumerlaeia bacterium]
MADNQDVDFSKLSKNEFLKAHSDGLRGNIDQEVMDTSAPAFSEDAVQLLKHHGTYQQDNRDLRSERRKAGLDKAYSMMLRTRTPGGLMSPEQYILCDDLATKYGQDDLRITSRQGFQFHGVLKNNLRALIHDLNHFQQISTQGACGDVVRNVTGCPVVDIDPAFADINTDILRIAARISTHFLAQSSSYYDLWLDDERVEVHADGSVVYKSKEPSKKTEEPIYGERYLPRKFKIGITVDLDNSIDVYTNDIGIIARTEAGRVNGFEVLVGGGLGHSHSKEETYARVATPLTFVETEEQLIAVVEGVVKAQRDHGNREQRHLARLKYTVDRMGADFKKAVEQHVGWEIPAPLYLKPKDQPHYLGWHKQHQPGLNYVGVWIENGRVRDFPGSFQFKTGLRKIVEKFRPSVRLTAHHNLLLANIRDEDVAAVKALLAEYHIPTDTVSAIRRLEMACPALPLCGLALAEAERELPKVIEEVEKLGHGDADVIIRMTGCPNSCARPETAEIGIIGRGPNKYNLYAGGDRLGTRMNTLIAESVVGEQLAPKIASMLSAWKAERNGHVVTFGDWSHTKGKEALQQLINN